MEVKEFNYEVLDQAIAKYGNQEKSLIAILQYAQEHYRYLPKEIFGYLAKKLNLSEAKIYGVATFYENFSLEKKGEYIIKVCDGTACHVRHSIPILEALRKELGLSEEKISKIPVKIICKKYNDKTPTTFREWKKTR